MWMVRLVRLVRQQLQERIVNEIIDCFLSTGEGRHHRCCGTDPSGAHPKTQRRRASGRTRSADTGFLEPPGASLGADTGAKSWPFGPQGQKKLVEVTQPIPPERVSDCTVEHFCRRSRPTDSGPSRRRRGSYPWTALATAHSGAAPGTARVDPAYSTRTNFRSRTTVAQPGAKANLHTTSPQICHAYHLGGSDYR